MQATCQQCNSPLSADTAGGLCPRCLFGAGLADTPGDSLEAALRAPPSPAELDALLPGYEVLGLAGRGGMGAVYRARQLSLDRTVAIKILPLTEEDDPEFAERFRREARALAQLQHPNIVTVHDFGETGDGRCYFAMEFVDGGNLADLVQPGGLGAERSVAVVAAVCDALHHAHEAGVIHRDIKPANVLIDGVTGNVKVADFGLAKILAGAPGAPPAGSDPTLSTAAAALGTPLFMAPEQRTRPLEVDRRADVYALGALCYTLLTGEPPAGNIAGPSQRVPGLPAHLDAPILAALDPDPDKRPATAAAFKAAITAVAATAAGPDLSSPAARPWLSRILKPHVFLSYAHAETDEAAARAAARHLEAAGVPCWIDQADLRCGEGFDDRIRRAVRRSCAVLWFASNASLQSGYVRHEISTAISYKKPIVPALLEDLDPDLLRAPFDFPRARTHGVPFTDGSTPTNLQKLARGLRPLVARAALRRNGAAAAVVALAAAAALTFLPPADRGDGGDPGTARGQAPGHATAPAPLAPVLVPASSPIPENLPAPTASALALLAGTDAPDPPEGYDKPRIEFRLNARRQGESTFRPISDGEPLRSNLDEYFIEARPLTAGHLYLFQLDAAGQRTWLFPRNPTSEFSAGQNPLPPDQPLRFPDARAGNLFLDDNTGVEHLFAVFSAAPWPALEQALAQADTPAATAAGATPKVTQPLKPLTRGVGGVRKDTYQADGPVLVVQRWFQHVNAD